MAKSWEKQGNVVSNCHTLFLCLCAGFRKHEDRKTLCTCIAYVSQTTTSLMPELGCELGCNSHNVHEAKGAVSDNDES